MLASGSFTVTLNPLTSYATGTAGINLGRMSIDKTFEGMLVGSSKGEMLSAMTAVSGSAGYVAIEQITGSLAGNKGSFVLQHSGTMAGGTDQLSLEVVPDSGTDELRGLSGSMTISQIDNQHEYVLDYELANTTES